MESHQSLLLENPPIVTISSNLKPNSSAQNSGEFSVYGEETMQGNSKGSIGVLEVYIHQARDIQNICIYHKQDVYAKICLTSDPETTVSTQIVNGGGRNPVFDENLKLNVQTIDSSLKCEIWMLSRVRNYLEDQLLGFALVPLSDVLMSNGGKLAQEFSLSSSDIFHSPSGFVQLAFNFIGDAPEVLEILTPRSISAVKEDEQDAEILNNFLPDELDKIEFLDPKIVNENHMMVSEFIGIPCVELKSQSSESLSSEDDSNQVSYNVGANMLESFSKGSTNLVDVSNDQPPSSSVSTTGVFAPSLPVPEAATSESISNAPKSPNQDIVSSTEEKIEDLAESEGGSKMAGQESVKPFMNAKVVAEDKVVQQEIVDMYLKSMQQFTESLAKMKLPMDIGNGSGNGTTDEKSKPSKGEGPRVFYGSRAFF